MGTGMAFSGDVSGGDMPWISDILESAKYEEGRIRRKREKIKKVVGRNENNTCLSCELSLLTSMPRE